MNEEDILRINDELLLRRSFILETVLRHKNIPTSERYCTVCKSGKIENEEHFLIHCPGYELQKQIFVNKINKIVLG
jgi:hypothetical protein